MIFVTVGSDIPFDRLVHVVDQWAKDTGRQDVFAQIGAGAAEPEYIQWTPMLEPSEFAERCRKASTIIAHAGMGSILTALHYGKPILVMPRAGSLGETRNEHQEATAAWLAKEEKVTVAADETELWYYLGNLEKVTCRKRIGAYAGESLLKGIRGFIAQERLPGKPGVGCRVNELSG